MYPNRSEDRKSNDVTSFSDLNLSQPLLKALAAEGYETPTPIQTQAIPHLLLPQAAGSRVLRFCRPVGSHDGIGALLETRLLHHCKAHGTNTA